MGAETKRCVVPPAGRAFATAWATASAMRAAGAPPATEVGPVVSAESLVAHIREQAVGSTVELTIVRDGKEQQVDVTLGQRPQDG